MAEYNEPEPTAPTPVEPEVVEDPKPNLDELLAVERGKTDEAQKALEKNQVAYDARMQQIETMWQERFAGKTPPPGEVKPAAAMPTAEDYLTPEGAAEATKRVAAAAANEMGQTIDATYRDALMQTRAAQFEIKYEALKTRKYFKYVESEMEDALTKNPNLRYSPESLDVLYNNYVGAATDKIIAEETPEPGVDNHPVHPNVSAPRQRVAPPTGPTSTPEHIPTELSAAEEAVRSKFAPYIKRMRKDHSDYTADNYARSRKERQGIEPRDPGTLEEKRG